MNRIIAVAILGCLTIASPALSQETFTGVWVVTTHVPDIETEDVTWTITEVDGDYVFESAGGRANMFGMPTAVDIQFDGMTFTITTTFEPEGLDGEFVVENSAVIDGDTFEGTNKFGDVGEYRITGIRQ